MAIVVKVVDGMIEEYENGSYRRRYGQNIVDADNDGELVVAVTAKGCAAFFEQ